MLALLLVIATSTNAPDLISGTENVASVAAQVSAEELGEIVDVGADFIVAATHPELCAPKKAVRLMQRFDVLVQELQRRCLSIGRSLACVRLKHGKEHLREARAEWRKR